MECTCFLFPLLVTPAVSAALNFCNFKAFRCTFLPGFCSLHAFPPGSVFSLIRSLSLLCAVDVLTAVSCNPRTDWASCWCGHACNQSCVMRERAHYIRPSVVFSLIYLFLIQHLPGVSLQGNWLASPPGILLNAPESRLTLIWTFLHFHLQFDQTILTKRPLFLKLSTLTLHQHIIWFIYWCSNRYSCLDREGCQNFDHWNLKQLAEGRGFRKVGWRGDRYRLSSWGEIERRLQFEMTMTKSHLSVYSVTKGNFGTLKPGPCICFSGV